MTDGAPLDAEVIIVGGGPVGTLLAAEVALGGESVLVLERETERPDTIKAGTINYASAEILARRGLFDEARVVHERTVDRVARLFADGDDEEALDRARRKVPRGGHFAGLMLNPDLLDHEDPDVIAHQEAAGVTLIAQAELEALLDGHAARLGVPVRRGVTVTGLREIDDRVEVETGDGTLTARWVVGCDGGRSAVRRLAGFEFPGTDPEITGRQAVIDVAEGDEDLLVGGWHWSLDGVYRLGPRPGVVLTVEFDGPPAERDQPVTAKEIQGSLRQVTGTGVTITGLRGNATRWTDNTRQAPTYRRGRVLLAGDAAHVHSPFGGQGLNLGLGDATNLGWKLAATAAGWAPEGLLDSYTDERHPIGAGVLDWTRAQIALMRPDVKTGRLRDVMAGMADTTSGMTHLLKRIHGITQHVDLPGDHPLTGHLVPDLTTGDGRSLRDRFTTGRFVLLDRTVDAGAADVARDWGGRVVVVPDDRQPTGPAVLLARPDGVVAWAADIGAVDLEGLRTALKVWAGTPGKP